MNFFHQGRVVMSIKSDKTHPSINTHPFAHILGTCALIFSGCSLFTVYPNGIPPLGDNHQSTGGRSERTQGQAKMFCLSPIVRNTSCPPSNNQCWLSDSQAIPYDTLLSTSLICNVKGLVSEAGLCVLYNSSAIKIISMHEKERGWKKI